MSHADAAAAFRTPPETVEWAYRLLLGREPESPGAVEGWARSADPATLRDGFLASEEMARLRAEGLPMRVAPRPFDLVAAARAALALLEGAPASEEAARKLAERHPTLAALRRHVLRHPSVLAASQAAASGVRHLLPLADGRSLAIQGDAEEPSLRPLAPRFAALEALARQLPERGAVIVDGEADLGAASLALVAARPGFASLRAFEPDVRRAMRLASNLSAHAPPRAKCAAVDLPPLAALNLQRIDLLRLPSAARLEEAGPWIARGALVLLPLRLREELLPGRAAPADTLRGWAARFPSARALGPAGPFPLDGEAAVAAALEVALDDPERRVDVALGGPAAPA